VVEHVSVAFRTYYPHPVHPFTSQDGCPVVATGIDAPHDYCWFWFFDVFVRYVQDSHSRMPSFFRPVQWAIQRHFIVILAVLDRVDAAWLGTRYYWHFLSLHGGQ